MLYAKEDGRINTKVSKIATMFQSTDEPSFSFEESKLRDMNGKDLDISKNSTVVRTESHVARFNNAKAMFEKMSGNSRRDGKITDIPGKINDVFHRNIDVAGKNTSTAGRPTDSGMSSLSPTGVVSTRNGTGHSRSPSPGAVNGRKSNGYAMPSVATISSTAISPPLSPVPSLISPCNSSPVPRSLTSSCRTLSASSSDSGDYPRKKEEKVEARGTSKELNGLMNHKKSSKTQKHTPSVNMDNTDGISIISHGIPMGPEEATRSSIIAAKSARTKSHISKPNKPSKPHALKSVSLSSHEHHQELMKRHKNWFQSYSRAKSPSSPVKSDSERTLSPDNNLIARKPILPNQEVMTNKSLNTSLHKSSTEGLSKQKEVKSNADKCELVKSFFSGGQSDLVKERSALFSGRQNQKSVSSSSIEVKSESFENSSTLPSKWCPPKQYAESVAKTVTTGSYSSNQIKTDTKSQKCTTETECVSMPAQLDATYTGQFQVGPLRSSSVDELERVEENVTVLRRRPENGENSFKRIASSEASLFRHSFHGEPDHTLEREVQPARRFSSLEGDRERRLKDWERKKTDREKRHSDGNLSRYFSKELFIQSEKVTNTVSKGNIIDRIRRYEDTIYNNNANQYHSSIELNSKSSLRFSEENYLSGSRLKSDLSLSVDRDMKTKSKIIETKESKSRIVGDRKQKEMQEFEYNRIEEDAFELKRREKEEVERKRREIENMERKQNEQEELDKVMKEQDIERKRRQMDSTDRRIKEQEQAEKRRNKQEMERRLHTEREMERRRKEKEDIGRRLKEQEERERKRKERELDFRKRKQELIERKQMELEENDRKQKEQEEMEHKRLEQEEMERIRLKQEELDRIHLKQEELERERLEQEEMERIRLKKEDMERRRLQQEKIERKRLQQEEIERKRLQQEELERKRLQQEEVERKRLKQEEVERKRLKQEEVERKRLQQEEVERKRLQEEEMERQRFELEEIERKRLQEEETERIHLQEEMERMRLQQEEMERARLQQEEIERTRLQQEEIEHRRLQQEEIEHRRLQQEEVERIRFQEEELEYFRKEREEIDRIRKEQEEIMLRQKEQEDIKRIRMAREEKERIRIEEEERERKQDEDIQRLRQERKEIERRRKEQEEIERKRKVQESECRRRQQVEIDNRQREQHEMIRKQREQEEIEGRQLKKLEIERKRRDQEKTERKRREKEEIESLRKEKEIFERLQNEKIEFDRKQRDRGEPKFIKQKTDEQKMEAIQNQQRKEEKILEDISQKEDDTNRFEIHRELATGENSTNRRIPPDVRSKLSPDEEIELGIERRRMQRKNEQLFKKIEEEKELERRHNLEEVIQRRQREVQQKLDLETENFSVYSQSFNSSDNSTIKTSYCQSDEEDRKRRENDRQQIMKTKQRIAELKHEREEIRKQQVAQMQRLLNSPDVNEMNPVASADHKEVSSIERSMSPIPSNNDIYPTPSQYLQDDGYTQEEIFYDHTVLSAQHKIELCSSSIGNEQNKYDDNPSDPPYCKYPTSTLSSVEPLPPPIPPHNVDPALLVSVEDGLVDPSDSAGLPQSIDVPDVMTPEEQQKLLSFNNDRILLSDAEANEARLLLDQSSSDPALDDLTFVKSSREDTPLGPDLQMESSNQDVMDKISLASSEEEGQSEVFVERVKEVMVDDGIHYLEDGHFWITIPGIGEVDDEILDPGTPFHKHTRLKFSSEPIRLFSTHSVSDYDRKNDDVDPVAASAEYELEKRVEKMDVFPVQVQKGECGLGLSIIGMGVGADAGVEKLGIFVKTITTGGVTEADGRIQVNDQIIEVDGKSLVGVTQIFAATVLKNTSGLVRFLIGREKDPETSEVAVLIRQSLQADEEREDRRRALEGPDFDPNNSGVFFDSLSSTSDDPSAIDGPRNRFEHHFDDINEGRLIDKDVSEEMNAVRDNYGHHVDGNTLASSEIMLLRHHLQEAQQTNEMYEEELNILRSKLNELEREVSDRDEMAARFNEASKKLQDAEETLQSRLAEISSYQDILEQSQSQCMIMEKKYSKAKKIIKEYQNRERDFLHREEYHITQLDEKDSHYNSLVKALKDRVIQLEGDLMKAHKSAGLPVQMTSAGSSVLNLPMAPRHSNKLPELPELPQSLKCLDADISDTETGEGATSEESRSSTVERKAPTNEDMDSVVSHSLLDVSASKAKGELASRGGLAKRHLPSLKKSGSQSSTGSCDRSRDDSLDENFVRDTSSPSVIYEHLSSEASINNSTGFTQSSSSQFRQEVFQNSSYYTALSSTGHSTHPPTSTPRAPPPYHPPPSAPLTQRPLSQSEWGTPVAFSYDRSEAPYRHAPPIARVQPVNRVDALESVGVGTHSLPLETKTDHQQRLADQLKAVLAERESSNEIASFNQSNPIKKSLSNLMEDVRQAVIQADVSLGKKPTISGPVQFTSTASESMQKSNSTQRPSAIALQTRLNRDSWSPQCLSSTATFPTEEKSDAGIVLLSQKPIDSSLSTIKSLDVREENVSMSSIDSLNCSALDTSGQVVPVCEWSKEQVAQWLMNHGLETCISKFITWEITGPRLINLDAKDLRNLGLSKDEKNKLKKKVKDLRTNIEKERKQTEKEKKEKEKLLKKAERLAEKAEKRLK